MDTTYLVKTGAPDGWSSPTATLRSMRFRKTAVVDNSENPGDKFASGAEYALCAIPAGFIPRYVVVDVTDPNAAAAALTVKAAKNGAASGTAVGEGTVALGTAGRTLVLVTAPWLAKDGDVLTATVSAAVDAGFEVAVLGDWFGNVR